MYQFKKNKKRGEEVQKCNSVNTIGKKNRNSIRYTTPPPSPPKKNNIRLNNYLFQRHNIAAQMNEYKIVTHFHIIDD